MQVAPVLQHDIRHNSRFPSDRFPQGALKCGEEVTLTLHLSHRFEYAEAVLRIWFCNRKQTIGGERILEESGSRVLFRVEMPKEPGLLWYSFLVADNGREITCGGCSGESGIFEKDPPAYRITVYDEAFKTPEWFCEGIVYQIFPDRFYKSDSSGSLARAAYHKNLGRNIYLHESWNEAPLYQPLPGTCDYEPCDFFGGDIDGIIQKLPYLKSLGVTCLYLNPVFESPSNHRYNTSDYLKIDPVLGDEQDLMRLSVKALEMGIRLMFDGVFSHTGDDSVYFNRYGRYSALGAYQSSDSEFFNWYDFEKWPDKYRCWWGFKTLPEVNETEPSYTKFIEGVLAYWAQKGITNWRLDVADELPDDFLRMLYKKLKQLEPEGVLLGEVWEDASNKISMGHRRPFTDGGVLDSVMNYPFAKAVSDFLTGVSDAFSLSGTLAALREGMPKPFYNALLNLLGSHDTERALSVYCGCARNNCMTREQQAYYKPAKEQLELGKKRLKLASLIQFCMPGVPCIYYADEAGAQGLCDPFNRGTYPWGNEDEELLDHYRLLTGKRSKSPALKKGLCAFGAKSKDVFFVARECSDESVILVVNRSEREAMVQISGEDFCEGEDAGLLTVFRDYTDLLTSERFFTENGALNVSIKPFSGRLLLADHR